MKSIRLTPNRRMASFLLKQHQQDTVFPLQEWLKQLYADQKNLNPNTPYCLNEFEEELVWEQIIQASEVGKPFLKTLGIARLAREAWSFSRQWQLRDIAVMEHTLDSQAYAVWSVEYSIRCDSHHWIDNATLIDWLAKQTYAFSKQIILVGFESLSPQLQHFFQALSAQGVLISEENLVHSTGLIWRMGCQNTEIEYQRAAAQA